MKPGTIISWTNKSGAPRSIVSDTNDDTFFSSDAQYPDGIPDGETWVWIVPDDMDYDTFIYYHDRLNGKPGNGENYGTGLVGLIEVAEPEKPVENPLDGPEGPGGPDALPPPVP
ncbi:MAG: hypothetical protein BWY76_00913 [bacterium ADurb.Bin429]|nr:MAG: hypothetical protein BWY76_00913 [bacterium ADurb.Bin429]